ncbi:HAMP domain-containing histidine kinase [Aquihabitans sp. G128]|uniref:sensor histidine kinase n=1 Tax=Aquihabitans sp. G128 TaxID=2849779 RepID=UPI001C240FD1|nr:HAMP domain-containing sensor histidine kinase [Aquihabitans sp. G128]QXC61025.1 HAMP domain-containing histidine kinase [Aquihabitans sp. G128]
MTLRLRLVLALVALSTVGLAVFGVTTYSLYQRSLESRLDDQLRATLPPLSGRLAAEASGVDDGPLFPSRNGPAPASSGGDQPGAGFGFDNYAALISTDGKVLAQNEPVVTTALPDLPDDLAATTGSRIFTTGSASGSGEWRVLVRPLADLRNGAGALDENLTGAVVVVATPTAELDAQMNRLLQIELVAAGALLTALAVGAWLILRRGLRPLEHMASSASTITAGDLSERVAPADGRTEVGQLGLALNTMLDGIEGSFRERDATERRLRQFLADASHELRTPLTSIQGFAELFRLGAGNDKVDLPVIMRRIEQESSRMKTLVEDLLLLARLDETRPSASEPVDLTVLAADACSDAVATAPDRAVTLDAGSPVIVRGDADHLRQAIANLVTNAVKHTPAGTPIEVATAVDGGRATITVRDHGEGISPEAAAHVFDRFWQADRARVGAGNGLGLAIVAGIAEEHGGTASVANHPDGGAAFTIDIPLAGRPATP